MEFIKRLIIIILVFIPLSFVSPKAYAGTLANASDTITTSRPSASAPILDNPQAASATQVTVADLPTTGYNSALWIASDSATILAPFQTGINVASMSGANTPSTNQRIVYLTTAISSAHTKGSIIYTPITATHTIQFTTNTAIPSSGHILITFPSAGANSSGLENSASPSATGFAFNNLTSSQLQSNNATTCTWTVTASATTNSIDCQTNAGIASNTVVTIIVGCTAQSSGVCTTFSPRLVNPTKTTAASGSNDSWKLTIQTTDTTGNGGTVLDSSKVVAGIVESVQVQGTVEPNLTFTISGTASNYQGCTQAGGDDTTNTGLATTATFVNLGTLNSAQVNRSYQTLQVDTNGSFGYRLTATSSGHFINPGSGYWLRDANTSDTGLAGNDSTNGTNPVPALIAANTEKFGIHSCANATSTTSPTIPSGWGTGGGASNKYANPWNSGTAGFYALLSYTSGASAASKTDVEYAAAVKSTTPAGTYSTVLTYVATPAF